VPPSDQQLRVRVRLRLHPQVYPRVRLQVRLQVCLQLRVQPRVRLQVRLRVRLGVCLRDNKTAASASSRCCLEEQEPSDRQEFPFWFWFVTLSRKLLLSSMM